MHSVCQGAAAVAIATGQAGSTADSVTPTGRIHLIGTDAERDTIQSRSEIMEDALAKLKEVRMTDCGSPWAGRLKRRVLWANDAWLKLYALMDYVSTR
eukprot:SAG31_NODE_1030_length_10250_cov_2.791942_1_plen_98_part_00